MYMSIEYVLVDGKMKKESSCNFETRPIDVMIPMRSVTPDSPFLRVTIYILFVVF